MKLGEVSESTAASVFARIAARLGCLLAALLFPFLPFGSFGAALAQDSADPSRTATQEESSAVAQESSDEEKSASEEADGDESRSLSSGEEFIRVRRDEDGEPLALETSITRYVKTDAGGKELIVDLVGVVHIGEREYYEYLNQHFESYDALLYELVAPEGTRIPEGGVRESEGFNPISGLQTGMKDMLALEFQLEHINYNQNNFVHADMSPSEFAESMSQNDESITRIFMKMIGQSMARQGMDQGVSDVDILMAMFSSNREWRLRKVMADQMQAMDTAMTMFEGTDGSTIITHRNRKALEVLQRELDAGKDHVGVFYGAGHLPDMEARLLDEFGMTNAGKTWLVAWKLDPNVEFTEPEAIGNSEEDASKADQAGDESDD